MRYFEYFDQNVQGGISSQMRWVFVKCIAPQSLLQSEDEQKREEDIFSFQGTHFPKNFEKNLFSFFQEIKIGRRTTLLINNATGVRPDALRKYTRMNLRNKRSIEFIKRKIIKDQLQSE